MAARSPEIPGARFSEKRPIFLKFIEPLTPLWVLQPSQNMHLVSTEALLARAVFAKQIKVRGWQPGAPKSREHDFPEKKRPFLKFIGPVTTLWVLQPSQIMHMVSTEILLSRAVFTRSINVPGWQPGGPKTREHEFPEKKRPDFFEIHRTSDNTVGSVDLCNHAFGFYGTFSSQSSVYKVK